MTFLSDEQGVSSSLPVELYQFTADGVIYRYTSHRTSYDHLSFTYTPVAGLQRRTTVRSSLEDKPPELIISMDESVALVQDNCYGVGPVDFSVRIYRVQPTGYMTWWDGKVAGTSTEGAMAEFRCPSVLDDAMRTTLPTVFLQRQCNHFLYDDHCQVNPASFTDSTTVAAVDIFEVELASASGRPDGFYTGGTIVNAAGERRLIVEHTGVNLLIFQPFRSLAVSASVTVRAGCRRDVLTCRDKFNNVANFGGYPLIPIENLWKNGFRGLRNQ